MSSSSGAIPPASAGSQSFSSSSTLEWWKEQLNQIRMREFAKQIAAEHGASEPTTEKELSEWIKIGVNDPSFVAMQEKVIGLFKSLREQPVQRDGQPKDLFFQYMSPFMQDLIQNVQSQFPQDKKEEVGQMLKPIQKSSIQLLSLFMDNAEFVEAASGFTQYTPLSTIMSACLRPKEREIKAIFETLFRDMDSLVGSSAAPKNGQEYKQHVEELIQNLWKEIGTFSESEHSIRTRSEDPLEDILEEALVEFHADEHKQALAVQARHFAGKVDFTHPKSDLEKAMGKTGTVLTSLIPVELQVDMLVQLPHQIVGIIYAASGVNSPEEFQIRSERLDKANKKIAEEDSQQRRQWEVDEMEALIGANPELSFPLRTLAKTVFDKIRVDASAYEVFKKEQNLVSMQLLPSITHGVSERIKGESLDQIKSRIALEFNTWLEQESKKRDQPEFIKVAAACFGGIIESMIKQQMAKEEFAAGKSSIVCTAFDEALNAFVGSPVEGFRELVGNIKEAASSTDAQLEAKLRQDHLSKHQKFMQLLQVPTTNPQITEVKDE